MKSANSPNRNPDSDPQPNTNGWQVVYTGFILIMLCFFIMLTSYASLQQSRITRFARSFSNAVSILPGGESLENGQTIIAAPTAVLNKEDRLAQLFEKVRRLSAENRIDQAAFELSSQGVTMTLDDRLLFDSGKAVLTDHAFSLLARIVQVVALIQAPVRIVGHTDSRPITTFDYPSNWELSTARAVSVLRYMVEKGISVKRLSAAGRAQYSPRRPNDSEKNMAANRRVEIIFQLD